MSIKRAMTPPALSIVQPVLQASPDLVRHLEAVRETVRLLGVDGEVVVSGDAANTAARDAAGAAGASWIPAEGGGFAAALRAGLAAARGAWILTLDTDSRGSEGVIPDLWTNRHCGEIIVASRYLARSDASMSLPRRLASHVINKAFGRGLSLPVTDLSSAYRLYRADVIREQHPAADNYDLLPEVLVRALAGGWKVAEIPLCTHLAPRDRSMVPLARLAYAYGRTFASSWQLRNSIAAGDYDARAHDSVIPLQRYWQRQRYKHVTELIAGEGAVLDVGCGSSRIIGALPAGSVAVDVLPQKLRFARRYGKWLTRASGFALPFRDASFPCVLCSQVIEHVPLESPILSELVRVLRPGGRLVLGTPDYDRWQWIYMEKAYGFFKPGGYADEHISHYSRDGLIQHFRAQGFQHEATRYVLQGELILAVRKPATAPALEAPL